MDQIYIGKLYDYTAYVRRISNYTSYVRRIIRYLKNKCTVLQCMHKANNEKLSVIQSSFWRETCDVVFLKCLHVRKRNERNDVRNTLKFETMF